MTLERRVAQLEVDEGRRCPRCGAAINPKARPRGDFALLSDTDVEELARLLAKMHRTTPDAILTQLQAEAGL